MSKYKAVIFDCDGVLVDSEPIGNRILVEMANELGVAIDLDYAYKHFKGNALQVCFKKIQELSPKPVLIDFEKEYRKRSFEAFKNEIQPVKGAKELIQNLKIPFCVASSGPVNKIRLNLELTGLLGYFEDRIFSCYDIGKWKPDPAVFIWAAETMGFKPDDCVVVEDSLLGVQAAINGGFDVIAYTEHDYSNALKKITTISFDSMGSIAKFLRK